jgi:hypothetical protein
MKVQIGYILGKPKTELYQTGNDFYCNGTIYRLPEGSFDIIRLKDDNDVYAAFVWDDENNEIVVGFTTDNPDDIGKTDWTFEAIPPEYYDTCPIVEVESNEAVIENTESSVEV